MPWTIASSRRSGRFDPIDAGDDEYCRNVFAASAEIHAFRISCPSCGTLHEVTEEAARPRAFDRQQQCFRCSRCGLKAVVRLTVDCGFPPPEPVRVAKQ
jgi:hypothetical protein